MGKHDEYGHSKHVSKQQKFKSPKVQESYLHQHNAPPQAPAAKTNANNRYLGGRNS